MRDRAIVRVLLDGRRLYLHDGPIDIVLEAFGGADEIRSAHSAAAKRFVSVLDELCDELALLRQRSRLGGALPVGRVARRMAAAVAPFAERTFITPMAAVAGAVAEEILEAMTRCAALERAYVNDGGDIALHIAPGQHFSVGMAEYPHSAAGSIEVVDRPSLFGKVILDAAQSVRGIATSGWRGRSFSLGIADAVTVLAKTASEADAAATVIANAVDLSGHEAITRVPACEIAPDNDLGEMLVTRGVGALSSGEIAMALDAGARVADSLISSGLIDAAALHLRGETLVAGVTREFACVAPPSENLQLLRSDAHA